MHRQPRNKVLPVRTSQRTWSPTGRSFNPPGSIRVCTNSGLSKDPQPPLLLLYSRNHLSAPPIHPTHLDPPPRHPHSRTHTLIVSRPDRVSHVLQQSQDAADGPSALCTARTLCAVLRIARGGGPGQAGPSDVDLARVTGCRWACFSEVGLTANSSGVGISCLALEMRRLACMHAAGSFRAGMSWLLLSCAVCPLLLPPLPLFGSGSSRLE